MLDDCLRVLGAIRQPTSCPNIAADLQDQLRRPLTNCRRRGGWLGRPREIKCVLKQTSASKLCGALKQSPAATAVLDSAVFDFVAALEGEVSQVVGVALVDLTLGAWTVAVELRFEGQR